MLLPSKLVRHPEPIAVLFDPVVMSKQAFPNAVLLDVLSTDAKAPYPTAVFALPEVFKAREFSPRPVFSVPEVITLSDWNPTPVFDPPDAIKLPDPSPINVLPRTESVTLRVVVVPDVMNFTVDPQVSLALSALIV